MSGGSGSHEGIAGPRDAAADFNASELHIKQLLAMIPGSAMVQIVTAPYDSSGNPIPTGSPVPIGYVDVLPSINQLDGKGKPKPHGIVRGLSYVRAQGGKNAVIVDPKLHDLGVAVFPSRDGSAMRKANPAGATKQVQSNPGSGRQNSWSDGIYLHSWSVAAPERWVTFTDSGINIVVKSGEKVAITGDLTVTGEVTAKFGGGSSVRLSHHTHAQGNDSNGDTEVETNSPTAGS